MDLGLKVKRAIFTILVPEYLVGKALSELLAAKSAVASWRELGIQCKEIHGFMANMGYFVRRTVQKVMRLQGI